MTRELWELHLSSFVGCSHWSDLVNPLVLRVVIHNELLNEAMQRFNLIAVWHTRRCQHKCIHAQLHNCPSSFVPSLHILKEQAKTWIRKTNISQLRAKPIFSNDRWHQLLFVLLYYLSISSELFYILMREIRIMQKNYSDLDLSVECVQTVVWTTGRTLVSFVFPVGH